MLSRVKLKRWLRTQDLEVQLGSWMRHAYESPQGQVARVQGDNVGRVEDEAVVEGGGGGSEEECGVWFRSGRVSGDFTCRDRIGVKG